MDSNLVQAATNYISCVGAKNIMHSLLRDVYRCCKEAPLPSKVLWIHKICCSAANLSFFSMPKSTGKKGPPLPGTPVRVTAVSHSCVAEATATASQSIEDMDKVVQPVKDQSNFEVCPICLETIIDTSDQVEDHNAIFCEGDGCRAWYHQWCAGINKQRYALLSVSDAPFYCPCCTMEQQNNAIIALQDTVKTLTTQLSELQAKFAEQPHSTTEQPSDATEQPWTVVVKKGKGPRSQVASSSRGKGKGKGHTISSDG